MSLDAFQVQIVTKSARCKQWHRFYFLYVNSANASLFQSYTAISDLLFETDGWITTLRQLYSQSCAFVQYRIRRVMPPRAPTWFNQLTNWHTFGLTGDFDSETDVTGRIQWFGGEEHQFAGWTSIRPLPKTALVRDELVPSYVGYMALFGLIHSTPQIDALGNYLQGAHLTSSGTWLPITKYQIPVFPGRVITSRPEV